MRVMSRFPAILVVALAACFVSLGAECAPPPEACDNAEDDDGDDDIDCDDEDCRAECRPRLEGGGGGGEGEGEGSGGDPVERGGGP